MWNKSTHEYSRPMKEVFHIEGRGTTEAVKRAATDFGIEKSFGRASRQFMEHYGFELSSSTMMRTTEKSATAAQRYLEERLEEGKKSYDEPQSKRPGVDVMVAELDGCELRTGKCMTAQEAGRTDVEPEARVRVEEWKEVRTGLVRPLGEVDSSYVCQMGSYETLCEQLFAMGCIRGLGEETKVVAPGDGGNGLMEEMRVHFPNFQYILDHPHMKSHFYETAEELGIEEKLRPRWIQSYIDKLWKGNSLEVIDELKVLFKDTGCESVDRLRKYLERFAGSVDYGRYKELGWPIASGEVESAHRYIPQERMKIPGACWKIETVNPMLSLRVIRATGWWEEFWAWNSQNNKETRVA
jgi:hypothetical protein